ncbi:ferrichrome ABC transporter substrate-binding protein [Bacteroides sp.]|uniref:ferrichrome ABC transporter substrate-binding protein n=1 Tax=Bacteroides sp. TaxID=29523 RepID=UPI00260F800A|nr:ferrichrome ABC transporter substrate-binding protein [Bacteroides sp.]MDD3036473.1 ferrichrome ABC transporter substrate-binding protein [Bacteroides sp.]
MEDIFKFLLLGGVIIISIVRSLKKAAASTEDQRPSTPKQPTVETVPDAVPIPEVWGKIFSPKDIFQSATEMKESTSSSQKQKNQKKHMLQSGSGNNVVKQNAESQSDIPHTSSSPVSQELSDSKEDFTIHSAEEARRAIIWGEILQRKY